MPPHRNNCATKKFTDMLAQLTLSYQRAACITRDDFKNHINETQIKSAPTGTPSILSLRT